MLPHPDLVRDELGVGEPGRPIGAARLLLEGYLERPHASEALALPSEASMIQRILCGLDFSPASVAAFAAATKAELHLVHVIEAYPVAAEWLPLRGIDDVMLSMEIKAKEAMDTLVQRTADALEGVQLRVLILV